MAVLVISYSRADQAQVRALVSLLKAGLRDVERAVFWDEQFEPGEPWFDQLKTHNDASPQLFVFWCDHSNTSEQVRREFTYALARKKRVVPVLLDDTPLAVELAPIHGIDLRGAIRHIPKSRDKTARDIDAMNPSKPIRAMAARMGVGLAAATMLAVSVLTTQLWIFSPIESPAVRDNALFRRAGPTLVSELVLDGNGIADSQGRLSARSRAQVDEFFQRNVVDPATMEILIESHSDAPGQRRENQAAESVMDYLIERRHVPPTGVSVRHRESTATDPMANKTVLKLLKEMQFPPPAPDSVPAAWSSLPVRLFVGAAILAILSNTRVAFVL